MTKILVISDTHNDKYNLNKVIKNEPNIDNVVFLGDGMADIEYIFINSRKPLYSVAGNCDTDFIIPSKKIINIENTKIFITHGHFYDVKVTFKNVAEEAKSKGCNFAFIGHTHEQTDETIDGVRIINPGSVSFFGHYAIVTVDNDNIDVEFKRAGNPYESLRNV
ncbi:MAG: metallophosphoesterase family protein [Eubacterium sp.]